MNLLKFDASKCTLCEICINDCPFGALSMGATGIEVSDACRMCGICVRDCPSGAMHFEQKAKTEDKSRWNDILVYAELEQGKPHPVVYELIGEARRLAAVVDYRVCAVMVGDENIEAAAEMLLPYGVDEVFVYEHPGFRGLKADCHADAVADCIAAMKPSVVLIGATAWGRSLAPRLSTRFHTGLTADCTQLEMQPDTDMLQIRPAFGGNIMAQIRIPNSRPQFATVRYRVMDKAEPVAQPTGKITRCEATDKMARSRVDVLEIETIQRQKSIEEEDILVVAGRGVRGEKGIALCRQLAEKLGGQLCFTRPMVEQGFGDTAHQIGLSGRTVRPKLIITCGVSGAVQFTAGMDGSDRVVAINTDPEAPIFRIATDCVVGDYSEIIPRLIARLDGKERG